MAAGEDQRRFGKCNDPIFRLFSDRYTRLVKKCLPKQPKQFIQSRVSIAGHCTRLYTSSSCAIRSIIVLDVVIKTH